MFLLGGLIPAHQRGGVSEGSLELMGTVLSPRAAPDGGCTWAISDVTYGQEPGVRLRPPHRFGEGPLRGGPSAENRRQKSSFASREPLRRPLTARSQNEPVLDPAHGFERGCDDRQGFLGPLAPTEDRKEAGAWPSLRGV